MDNVLVLNDDSVIVPSTLFEVMDLIEERMGVDVRQYLESFMEETEHEPFTPDDQMATILDVIGRKIALLETELSAPKLNRQNVYSHIETIRNLVNRYGRNSK